MRKTIFLILDFIAKNCPSNNNLVSYNDNYGIQYTIKQLYVVHCAIIVQSLYNIVQYCTILYNIVQYCAIIVQYCTKESIVYNTLIMQVCNILSYTL